eukprot:TRINITY_DN27199_c0_g1_i1.p1 TRINITY_DN27199_c0_g1~~TRINITY_DN27199_c0_g1_i1.p1  ORF type:complete len:1251 (+),score=474.73 TRINITY_DN27199_c0_g1_i1:174-3926(+)
MEPFESIVYKTPPAEFAPKSSRFRPESDLPNTTGPVVGKKKRGHGVSPGGAGMGGRAVQLKKLGPVKPLPPPPQQTVSQLQRPVLLPGHGHKVQLGVARGLSPPPLSNTWGGMSGGFGGGALGSPAPLGGSNTIGGGGTSSPLSYTLSPTGSPTAFPQPTAQLPLRAFKSPRKLPGGVPSPRLGQGTTGYSGNSANPAAVNNAWQHAEAEAGGLAHTVGSVGDSGAYGDEYAPDGLGLVDLTPPSRGMPNLKKLDLDQVVPDTDRFEPVTPRFTIPATVEVRQGASRQVIDGFAVNLDSETPGSDQALCYNVRAQAGEVFADGGLPVIDCCGTLTFTPSYHFGGSTLVTVTLSDNAAICAEGVKTSKPATFKLTVVPGNVVVRKPKDYRSQTNRQNMLIAVLPQEDVQPAAASSPTHRGGDQPPSHSVFPPWNIHGLRDPPRVKGHQDRTLRKIIGFCPLEDIVAHRMATQQVVLYSAAAQCSIPKQFVRGAARGGSAGQKQLPAPPSGEASVADLAAAVHGVLAAPEDAPIQPGDVEPLCRYIAAAANDNTPAGKPRVAGAMGRVVMHLLHQAGFSFATSADDGDDGGLGKFDLARVGVLIDSAIETRKVSRSHSNVRAEDVPSRGENSVVTAKRDRAAAALLDYARVAVRQREWRKAREAAALAVKLFTALHGTDHHFTVAANMCLAEMSLSEHRVDEACEAAHQAKEGGGLVHLPTDPESAVIAHLHTYCLRRGQQISADEALRHHQQAHAILLKHCRPTTDARNNPATASLTNTLGESYLFVAWALHAKGAFSEAMGTVEAAVGLGCPELTPWVWKLGAVICLFHSRYKEGSHTALRCVEEMNNALEAVQGECEGAAGDPAYLLLRAIHPAVEVASGASSLTLGTEGLQKLLDSLRDAVGDAHPFTLQVQVAVGAALLKRCGGLTPKEHRLKDATLAEARSLLYDAVEKETHVLSRANPQLALTLELAAAAAQAELNYHLALQYLQAAKHGLHEARLEEIGAVGSSGMLGRVYEARVAVLCLAQIAPPADLITEYHEMAENFRRAFGEWDSRLVASLLNLAEVCYIRGEYDVAHRHFAKALANVDSQNMHFLLGTLFRPATQLATAIEVQERNRLASERMTAQQCIALAKVLSQIAMVYERQGHIKQAETSYMQTLASFEIAGHPHHIGVCTALDGLARLLYCQGHHGDALSYFDKAYTIRCNFHGALKEEIAASLKHMQIVESRVRQSGYNLVKHELPGRFPVYY